MVIDKIEIYNFRIYKGLNVLDLTCDPEKNIIIVSGKNGFGKTTLLISMVWCMYGKNMQEVDDLYRQEILEQKNYNQYLVNCLNRAAKADGGKEFYVAITFSNFRIPGISCKQITIKRKYNIENKSEDLQIFFDDKLYEELNEQDNLEHFIRDSILPIEIAKFFFFDAEKIVSLSETNSIEHNKKLSKDYAEVLGIKKYEKLKSILESIQTEIKKESATAEEINQFIDLDAKIKQTENSINDTKKDIEELKEKKSELENHIREIENELLIKKSGSITFEKVTQLRQEETSLKNRKAQLMNELKDCYEIIPLAIAGLLLYEVFLQIENEKKYIKNKDSLEKYDKIVSDILTELMYSEKPKDLIITYNIQKYYNEKIEELIKKYFLRI